MVRSLLLAPAVHHCFSLKQLLVRGGPSLRKRLSCDQTPTPNDMPRVRRLPVFVSLPGCPAQAGAQPPTALRVGVYAIAPKVFMNEVDEAELAA